MPQIDQQSSVGAIAVVGKILTGLALLALTTVVLFTALWLGR